MDINNFRWILAGLGVVLVAGIYIRERIRYRQTLDPKRQTGNQSHAKIGDFSLQVTRNEIEESLELPSIRNDRYGSVLTKPNPTKTSSKSDNAFGILQIKVVAHEGMCFPGKLLINTLSAAGLEYGSKNIFHKQPDNAQLPLFSVVNMVEPGTFPIDEASHFESPGIVFFMQVATLIQPLNAFDEMLRTVHVLAARMGGEIRDAENILLTVEKTESIRNSLAHFPG